MSETNTIAQLAWALSTYAAVVAMDPQARMTKEYRSDLIDLIERVQDACRPLVNQSGTMPVDEGHVQSMRASAGGKP